MPMAGCTPVIWPRCTAALLLAVITGRLKDMIIRGGENIYPREIEQVLFAHEDVADVAVVDVPDPTSGEQVGRVRHDLPMNAARPRPAALVLP